MNAHFIAVLKKRIDARYGSNLSSTLIDSILQENAPEFYQAKNLIRTGNLSWITLKKYSTFCRYDESHEQYVDLLQTFDPTLKFPPCLKAKFIGDGFGDGSLNSYRIVKFSNKQYFEKIYLRASSDYKNILWFYKNLQPTLVNTGVKNPALKSITEGDQLAIIYTEYFEDTTPIVDASALYAEKFQSFFDIKQSACRTNKNNFMTHALYIDGKKKAATYAPYSLDNGHEALTTMEESMSITVQIFSHGDWYHKNINKEGVIFDWDRCGFYPAGFDLAYCLSKSLAIKSLDQLDSAIKQFIPQSLLAQCQQSIWFFCFIFYSRRVGVQLPVPLLRNLYTKVKSMLA